MTITYSPRAQRAIEARAMRHMVTTSSRAKQDWSWLPRAGYAALMLAPAILVLLWGVTAI